MEDASCFLVAGIIFSGAAVYYHSRRRVIEPRMKLNIFKYLHRIANNFAIFLSPKRSRDSMSIEELFREPFKTPNSRGPNP